MSKKQITTRGISFFIAILFIGALFSRCASMGSPEGGPKDSLPPVIIAMTPDNFTKNMDPYTRKIYIEFNEFVQITDQQKEFFTSPQMKNKPQLQVRGRGVVVTLRDTLKENTTYALNFGSSIRDNNESNPLYSMRYVFSTGDNIDSMIVSGYAEGSFKPDSVSGAFAMFFPVDSINMTAEYDSTLLTATPAVIARAEKNGIFLAQNLKPIPYHVYAVEDTNNNFMYDPGVDQVGFLEGTHNPTELPEFAIWYDSTRHYVVAEPQLHFRMFMDQAFKRQLLIESQRPLQHKAVLNFGSSYPQIDSIILDSIPQDKIIIEHMTQGRDTIALWFNMPAEQIPDTIRGRVVYFKHDSIRQLSRVSENLSLPWKYFESKAQTQEREKLERERKRAEERGEAWEEPTVENPFKLSTNIKKEFNPEQSLYFDFEYPIAQLDSASITLQYLSPEAVELRTKLSESGETTETLRGSQLPYRLFRDTMNARRWHIEPQTGWGGVGSEYFLYIPQGSISDIAGFSNDSTTYEFTPLNPENFATLILNVQSAEDDEAEYVFELMDESEIKILDQKTGIRSGRVQFNYVPAGNVTIRVLQDMNSNSKWDSGNLIERIQPERAQFISSNDERKIATKVNWEIEIDVNTETLFAPESQADLVARLAKAEANRLAKRSGDTMGGAMGGGAMGGGAMGGGANIPPTQ